jgi:SAM-dependent methyltransferase
MSFKDNVARLWWRLRGRPEPATWRLRVPSGPMYYNEVMPNQAAIDEAVAALGWEHPTRAKTWDFYKAVQYLQQHASDPANRVLDAGCVGSPVLEWLYGRGHRKLYGVDLSRHDLPAVPGLTFHKADLTRTPFPDRYFGAITCISVIEHGVDLEAFLGEAARLLTPGGSLLVSLDYADPKIDTADVPRELTFDLPWTVFDRKDIERLIAAADPTGLELVQPVRWDMTNTPVSWNGKQYSFLFLAFTKR